MGNSNSGKNRKENRMEYWKNEYSFLILKTCCSCEHCKGSDKTLSTTTPLRYCNPHKVDGQWTSAKVVSKGDYGCEDWTAKRGLLKAGRGDGHDPIAIDVAETLRKMGRAKVKILQADNEDSASATTQRRVRLILESGLRKFEAASIAKQEEHEAKLAEEEEKRQKRIEKKKEARL